jgi:hypothetical protein
MPPRIRKASIATTSTTIEIGICAVGILAGFKIDPPELKYVS